MGSLTAYSRVMSYSGSKAAVDQMMKVMALEWGPHQVITPTDRKDSSQQLSPNVHIYMYAGLAWDWTPETRSGVVALTN